MSQLKIRPETRKMSLDEAMNSKMTPEAWKAYMERHEMQNTRRDD